MPLRDIPKNGCEGDYIINSQPARALFRLTRVIDILANRSNIFSLTGVVTGVIMMFKLCDDAFCKYLQGLKFFSFFQHKIIQ